MSFFRTDSSCSSGSIAGSSAYASSLLSFFLTLSLRECFLVGERELLSFPAIALARTKSSTSE